jgi:membrane dipeptidase
MIKGGLDASFFIVYVGQGPLTPDGYADAYKQAIAKFEAIHRLTEQIAPDKIELALTAADVPKIAAKGKKIALIGVENAYPLGTDIGRVKEFYDRGARYMSLAHNGHSQFSDSNTGEREGWMHNGLSDLGKQVIAEMNKWGIMVDVSHPSKGSMMQAIGLSKAPVIASHSAVRKLANVSRNMDDEMLMAMKTNGGVVQMVALSGFVKADPPERGAAINALRQEFGVTAGRGAGGGRATTPPCPVEGPSTSSGQAAGRGGRGGRGDAALDALAPNRRAEYDRRLADIDRQWPAAGRATVKDYVDHIDYAVKLIGIDHVGISSDFDGGGGVDGWNSAAETFNVTLELVRRGYTEEQIGKIWSGNLLRVWGEVERVAKQLQKR